MRAPSGKTPASTQPAAAAAGLAPRDAPILAVVLAIAFLLMARSGFKRAVELMPWPDGLEYAAVAVNLDQGRGAVLHFGGYSYPSRYTEGYPLLLAAAYPLLGHDVAQMADVTISFALLAIVALYVLTLELFGRASAIIAVLLLAVSPVFITNATLVLSDVPTLALTILAALALARATLLEQRSPPDRAVALTHWAIFGLLAGFTVIIRPTNAAILVGILVGVLATRPPRLRDAVAPLVAFGLGFAPLPLWQLHENAVHLGRALASGYAYWVPEVYGVFSRTFNAGYLLGPTLPSNPYGNLPVYLLTLCGLDSLLKSPGAPPFYLYPFGAAAFAAIGFISVQPSAPNRAARRTVFFGLGFLAALAAVYLLYVFSDVAFILPGCFVLFALAGYGVALAHRRFIALRSKRRRSIRENLTLAGILLLDLLLALPVASELMHRLSVSPPRSEVVPALRTLDRRLEPAATVVSNLSLLFLELYIPAPGRSFVGLHSFDPGGEFTDYHLGRLYAKRSHGWLGQIPPVVFDAGGMVAATADSLATRTRAGGPVYLLLWMPPSADYAEAIAGQLDRLRDRFRLEEAAVDAPLALYRLYPR